MKVTKQITMSVMAPVSFTLVVERDSDDHDWLIARIVQRSCDLTVRRLEECMTDEDFCELDALCAKESP